MLKVVLAVDTQPPPPSGRVWQHWCSNALKVWHDNASHTLSYWYWHYKVLYKLPQIVYNYFQTAYFMIIYKLYSSPYLARGEGTLTYLAGLHKILSFCNCTLLWFLMIPTCELLNVIPACQVWRWQEVEGAWEDAADPHKSIKEVPAGSKTFLLNGAFILGLISNNDSRKHSQKSTHRRALQTFN